MPTYPVPGPMAQPRQFGEETRGAHVQMTQLSAHPDGADDGRDVVAGLTAAPKWVPTRFLYDERGSQLFERITDLPEYYPTRTELAIMERHAPDIAAATGASELIELGSGSARKIRALLDAFLRDGRGPSLRYVPVDVSAAAVRTNCGDLAAHYPGLDIRAFVGTYEQALAALPPAPDGPRLALFLGSTIGNLTEMQLAGFLDAVHAAIGRGAWFLVGMDLQKPADILEAAYDDAEGVTATFNLNVLHHLNWRFDGDFEVPAFKHVAYYDRSQGQIEMHLESLRPQTATLRAIDLTVAVAEGERIHTEISRKFNLPEIFETFAARDFQRVCHWTDPKDWFALALFRSV